MDNLEKTPLTIDEIITKFQRKISHQRLISCSIGTGILLLLKTREMKGRDG